MVLNGCGFEGDFLSPQQIPVLDEFILQGSGCLFDSRSDSYF